MRRSWLLNLDAEQEMAAASLGHSYQISGALRRSMQLQAPLVEALTQGDDWWFPDDFSPSKETAPPLVWCGTSGLLASLNGSPWSWAGPSPSLTHAMNDKALLCGYDWTLPRRAVVTRMNELDQWLERELELSPVNLEADALLPHGRGGAPLGRIKPRWSWAGRGQRTLSRTLSEDDQRFVAAQVARGAVIEPFVREAAPSALHGVLSKRGNLVVGAPVVHHALPAFVQPKHRVAQALAATQAPAAAQTPAPAQTYETARAPMEANDASALVEQVAELLRRKGWWGPFGIDLIFHQGQYCVIDLNARFTMAWSVGMAGQRDNALELVAAEQF